MVATGRGGDMAAWAPHTEADLTAAMYERDLTGL